MKNAAKAFSKRLEVYRQHPATMVREMFGIEPDKWQEEALEAFPHTQRLAMKACKGPGKTTVLAWIGWNFLLTRPRPKCAATSISGQNLKDNFWTEMAKWQDRSPYLKKNFEWTAQRITCRDSPEEWFMSARSWSASADATKQADTLAGLHADYILFILDETGSMPDSIMASAEAALSSCIEGHIVQAGNPTMLSGPLYRAASVERRLWKMVEITGDPDDPKRSTRISVEWARQQIEKYGKDNPWVLVNVFGRFPPSSLNTLIGPDEVAAAMNRYYRPYEIGNPPKIMGVDVARFGDDASVIAKREGILMLPFAKYRNIDSTQGAGLVARVWGDWEADAVFIDATGGFGAGWIDQLILLGKSPVGVTFSAEAHDKSRYHNKRAEMAFQFVEWIRRGGALPQSPELTAALTQTTYTFQKDRFLLEPKEDVKDKIGYSPDEFDASIMTFAEPVQGARRARAPNRSAIAAYDPFGDLERSIAHSSGMQSDYDPFREQI